MMEFIRNYFNEKNKDNNIKVFNTVHFAIMVSMMIMCIIVPFFVHDKRAVYFTIAIVFLILFTIVEVNRKNNWKINVIILSIVFNVIYLPTIFIWFGKFVSVIPMYYVFGLLYTILFLETKTGIILSTLELVFNILIFIHFYNVIDITNMNTGGSDLRVIYIGAIIGFVFSSVCSGAIVRMRYLYFVDEYRRSEEVKEEAQRLYVDKDIFLMNMSHEIRTPMNAIVGLVNLLLEKDISDQVSESASNILNSCNALLSITDELMDLSKSESGDITLYTTSYDFNDFIMEIINMITVRMTERNLVFFVEINSNIPQILYGDTSKLRQVLIHLLNNSNKFTEKGKIILRIDYRNIDSEKVELIFDIEDTGVGIKKEYLSHIFDRDFYQEMRKLSENSPESEDDSRINARGLGLSLCSDIVKKMNGDITVQSEYHIGSTFTVKVPQKIVSSKSIVNVIEPADYYALVFEKNTEYASNVKKMFDSLGIKCDIAKSNLDVERLVSVNSYTHIFMANENYSECEDFFSRRLNTEKFINFLGFNESNISKKASTIINRPVNIISLAAMLNSQNNDYVRSANYQGDFSCPHITILVVDDNQTNLNVASLILKKYDATILTAISGKDCLRVLSEHDVDMIFLDYMMPEMNGIDTLKRIRNIPGSKYTAMPVVALTANVVSGAKEMFLKAGFDDFLAKPISIKKLEKILRKLLPHELIIEKKQED